MTTITETPSEGTQEVKIKKYFTNESLSTFVDEIKAYTDSSVKLLSQVFYAGTSAPSDTKLLWIDTGNSNVMKFYDGSAWVSVNFAWTT